MQALDQLQVPRRICELVPTMIHTNTIILVPTMIHITMILVPTMIHIITIIITIMEKMQATQEGPL